MAEVRTTSRRWFMVFPKGTVEECVDEAGSLYAVWTVPNLYEELVLAGYPVTSDPEGVFDAAIDLSTDGSTVAAYTARRRPYEHDMGPAAAVFLDWYRTHADEVD